MATEKPVPENAAAPTPAGVPVSATSQTHAARAELLHHVEGVLEPLLASLGLLFLALVLVDLSGMLGTPEQALWLDRVIAGTWVIFAIDFLVRYDRWMSSSKPRIARGGPRISISSHACRKPDRVVMAIAS